MRDPHVVSVTYRVVTSETHSFSPQTPPLSLRRNEFDIYVADGIVRIAMLDHYPSVAEATRATNRLLRSWEIAAALEDGTPYLCFEFSDAEIIDRNPPGPGEPQVAEVSVGEIVMVGEHAVVHKEASRFPAPPADFVASADVEMLWARFLRYKDGGEPLSSMGYAILTYIEASAGSRKIASATYGIDMAVLSELGRMTSVIGDQSTARKFSNAASLRAFSPSETLWIETAIRRIIRRVGEVAFGGSPATLPVISINDIRA